MPRTGRRLVLKDGTTFENGEAGHSDGFLWCYLDGITLAEAAMAFTDAEKTDRIEFQYGEAEDVYEHYTDVRYLSNDSTGRIAVCLKIPER